MSCTRSDPVSGSSSPSKRPTAKSEDMRRHTTRWTNRPPILFCPALLAAKVLLARFLYMPLPEVAPLPFAKLAMTPVQSTPFWACWLVQHAPNGLPPPSVFPSGRDVVARMWLTSFSCGYDKYRLPTPPTGGHIHQMPPKRGQKLARLNHPQRTARPKRINQRRGSVKYRPHIRARPRCPRT